MITTTADVVLGICGIAFSILGLRWLPAIEFRWANGKMMFRKAPPASPGAMIVTGAPAASDILPDSRENAATKREEEARTAG